MLPSCRPRCCATVNTKSILFFRCLTKAELYVQLGLSTWPWFGGSCIFSVKKYIAVQRTLPLANLPRLKPSLLEPAKVPEWKLNKMDNLCLKTDECQRWFVMDEGGEPTRVLLWRPHAPPRLSSPPYCTCGSGLTCSHFNLPTTLPSDRPWSEKLEQKILILLVSHTA